MKETLALAADHAGFAMKESVKKVLLERGLAVQDFGTDSEESVDYPDYAEKAVRALLDGRAERGILVCGSGIGMSIVANRFPGIRAALVSDPNAAAMCRKHNNANVLVLAGRQLGHDEMVKILEVWLETDFEGGRHQKRLDRIETIAHKIAGPAKGDGPC